MRNNSPMWVSVGEPRFHQEFQVQREQRSGSLPHAQSSSVPQLPSIHLSTEPGSAYALRSKVERDLGLVSQEARLTSSGHEGHVASVRTD